MYRLRNSVVIRFSGYDKSIHAVNVCSAMNEIEQIHKTTNRSESIIIKKKSQVHILDTIKFGVSIVHILTVFSVVNAWTNVIKCFYILPNYWCMHWYFLYKIFDCLNFFLLCIGGHTVFLCDFLLIYTDCYGNEWYIICKYYIEYFCDYIQHL